VSQSASVSIVEPLWPLGRLLVDCEPQVGFAQDGLTEVDASTLGVDERGAAKLGNAEARSPKVGPDEGGIATVSSPETGLLELGSF